MSGEPKPKVTLEDLLRLKREERPAPEFWSRFDRELRAKQLAALVEKRPWWQGLPAWALNWRRFHLPLGATAVLAVTLVALRDSGGHPVVVGAAVVGAPVVELATGGVFTDGVVWGAGTVVADDGFWLSALALPDAVDEQADRPSARARGAAMSAR